MKKTVTFEKSIQTFFIPNHDESRNGLEWMLAALDRKRARQQKKEEKRKAKKIFESSAIEFTMCFGKP